MIFAGRYNVSILLTMGATVIALPLVMGQETSPAQSQPSPDAGGGISINMLHSAATRRPCVVVLAGSTVKVKITGRPKSRYLWRFAYKDTVLAKGFWILDAKGTGKFDLVLPSVRSRAECSLVLTGNGEGKVIHRLVLFPAARLADCAKLIKAQRFAVIDGSGKIQKTFKSEKVHFEDLSSQLLQDSFDGGVVFLATFEKPVLLNDACERLQGRIEKGMFAVIVNPPEKWSGWGASRRRLSMPVKSGANFSSDFGRSVRPDDIGAGPWRSVLHTRNPLSAPEWVADMSDCLLWFPIDSGRFFSLPALAVNVGLWTLQFALEAGTSWRMLAWIETVDKNEGGKQHRAKRPLISARPVGRGAVIVVMLPQMTDPSTNAVGRAVLDELVLWILKIRSNSFKEKVL